MATNKIAQDGEKILFKRNGFEMVGEVVKVYENSVVVNISTLDARRIQVETPKTVVSHKNYQILSKTPS